MDVSESQASCARRARSTALAGNRCTDPVWRGVRDRPRLTACIPARQAQRSQCGRFAAAFSSCGAAGGGTVRCPSSREPPGVEPRAVHGPALGDELQGALAGSVREDAEEIPEVVLSGETGAIYEGHSQVLETGVSLASQRGANVANCAK